MNNYKLLLHTVRYLKFKQIYYRVYYFIRNYFLVKNYRSFESPKSNRLVLQNSINYSNSFLGKDVFSFLNVEHRFRNKIDWNFEELGKLWTYNLNYFDFLNQKNVGLKESISLIEDYINNDKNLKDGHEPYPISLRGINWIKFLSKHENENTSINQKLYEDYLRLCDNLEYHLLGNHLLENGFSLLFGAYYFKNDLFYKKAKQILKQELTEQILNDGAHFELSPMYHQILLHRLLDTINLIHNNPWKQDALYTFLKEKAIKMLSWLDQVTFNSGNIPMVNDSAYGIAPTSRQLFGYAKNIGLQWGKVTLMDSGYRMFRNKKYELFVDVGNIGPKYQPGHAHSDTFNFELYIQNTPIIVDTGTSTYEKDEIRLKQRQTGSHNTVKIGNHEQTQVWDGFRVGKRAEIINLKEDQNYVEATHNGYKNLDVLHTRRFTMNTNIEIKDEISKPTSNTHVAFFHFHPDIKEIQIVSSEIYLPKVATTIQFKGDVKIEQKEYDYALGFNKTKRAKKIEIYFNTTLFTTIVNTTNENTIFNR